MQHTVNIHSRKGHSGQALIEFTLFVTLLFLAIAAAVDIANGLLIYTALTDAAQEGATYAAIAPTCTAAIEERALSIIDPTLPSLEGLSVSIEYLGTPTPGNAVTVRVEGDYQLLFPLSPIFFGTPPMWHIRSQATTTILRSSSCSE